MTDVIDVWSALRTVLTVSAMTDVTCRVRRVSVVGMCLVLIACDDGNQVVDHGTSLDG